MEKCMDIKKVDTVIARLVAGNSEKAVGKVLADQKELADVLNEILDMGKQLKEKDALDAAVEKKRGVLTGVENDIDVKKREGESEINSLKDKARVERQVLLDTKSACVRKIKDIEAETKGTVATMQANVNSKLEEGNEILADYKTRKQKAKQECEEMESKAKAMKEELIAKL